MKKKDDGSQKISNIRCRASGSAFTCEGNRQLRVWKKPLPTGGHSYRYRCLTCKKTWFIVV